MDDDDRDDMIVEQRISGRSVRALARQYKISSAEIEAVIDQRLNGALDTSMRLKAIRLDVARLDSLLAMFYLRAMKERDVPSGVLCVKILERRAMLLGLDSSTRLDIVQLQTAERPSSYAQIRQAVMALKYSGNGQQSSDGNGSSDDPAAGDGGER